MLDLSLNRSTKQSLYRQIAEQIKTQIGDGRLPANTRLPTVRSLAQQLGVTRLTIQNAYNELQADGWIEATVGRGTFVSSAVQPISLQPTIGQYLNPDNALSDMLEINQIVGVRSMAMAHPDPALFPTEEFWPYLERLRPSANELFSYGPIQGDPDLRVEIAKHFQAAGMTAVPNDILITSGAMHGISLAAQALAKPGDMVLVDQPTFLGTLNILKALRLNWTAVPIQPDGPDLNALEEALQRHKPRFYYTNPNFHNPTGICFSSEKRQAVLALTRQHHCAILEDDIYGDLAYDAPALPSLKALSTAEDHVIYLSGFSKVLMPGLRLGSIIMPPDLRTRLLTLRRSTDLCSPGLFPKALAHFLRDGGLKRHLKRVLPVYRERRDALMSALQTHMPHQVQWTMPQGGFCTWVTLPHYFASGELYRIALQNGFAFTPGEAYLMDDDTADHFRLCFGNQSTTSIRAGVELLSRLIRHRIEHGRHAADWLPVM